jgi:superfamily II DNA/RNA helicase
VDFGNVDAEGETNLSEYFVDTGVLSRLISGRKQFVIGRKGSGKTALFLLASEEKLERPVLKLDRCLA